jgi:hypothetical protein
MDHEEMMAFVTVDLLASPREALPGKLTDSS